MEFRSNRASATVSLDGGRLTSLTVDGLELLVGPRNDPMGWGSFPMLPWAGRLRDGRFEFGGRVHQMPLNLPPHSIHGLAFTQRWKRVDSQTIRTELTDPWPFGGHAVQRFKLDDRSLTVTAAVHASERPMPAMIGWHPWFRRRLGRGEPAKLAVRPRAAYHLDESLIPTGDQMEVPPPPWDHCFVGLAADPIIVWPGALALTVSSTLDHWVIYTQPEHALCVEPQSGPPDQFNLGPRTIPAGGTLEGSMTLSWSNPR